MCIFSNSYPLIILHHRAHLQLYPLLSHVTPEHTPGYNNYSTPSTQKTHPLIIHTQPPTHPPLYVPLISSNHRSMLLFHPKVTHSVMSNNLPNDLHLHTPELIQTPTNPTYPSLINHLSHRNPHTLTEAPLTLPPSSPPPPSSSDPSRPLDVLSCIENFSWCQSNLQFQKWLSVCRKRKLDVMGCLLP